MTAPRDPQLRDSDRYLRGEVCWSPANDDPPPSDNWPWIWSGCITVTWLAVWGAIDIVRRVVVWLELVS